MDVAINLLERIKKVVKRKVFCVSMYTDLTFQKHVSCQNHKIRKFLSKEKLLSPYSLELFPH